MRFSQRIGITPIKVEIQKDDMDKDLRVGLWNTFKISYLDNVKNDWISDTDYESFFRAIWANFFKYPLDTMNDRFITTYEEIRKWFFECEWYEIYDFLEYIYKIDEKGTNKLFEKFCNIILERELSAYRFIDGIITEITDENELKEIEEAINKTKLTKLSGVQAHLKSALTMFSDKKNPDYRNSIKESISAVESLCKIISGDKKAELGKALNKIDGSLKIHPALKKGFSCIYGYTSDEDGIRHAMLEEKEIYYEDAKYMLVSCSAFINYLVIKAAKVGIKFK